MGHQQDCTISFCRVSVIYSCNASADLQLGNAGSRHGNRPSQVIMGQSSRGLAPPHVSVWLSVHISGVSQSLRVVSLAIQVVHQELMDNYICNYGQIGQSVVCD